jgi:CDP-glucose 4,6-dehydratase
LIGHAYAKTCGLAVGITRCGSFYGCGDLNWDRIVTGTICTIQRGHRSVIRSNGNYIRDYFYVEDGSAT